MKLETKGEFDDDKPSNPKIPENYYDTELSEIISYDADGKECYGLVMQFRIVEDDVEVENDFDLERSDGEIVLPFFAPAKLSVSEERESSRLSENLEKIGLHEAVLDILDDSGQLKESVLSGREKALATTKDEVEELKTALKAVFAEKVVNVDVVYNNEGDESQVGKFSSVEDVSESSSEDAEGDAGGSTADEFAEKEMQASSEDEGDGGDDVLFDDDDETGSENEDREEA